MKKPIVFVSIFGLALIVLVAGCKGSLDTGAILDMLKGELLENQGQALCEYRETIIEIAEMIPTCEPTPTAIPTPIPPPSHYEPSLVLSNIDVTETYDHTGLCVCTGSYLAPYISSLSTSSGGCISFKAVTVGSESVTYSQMIPYNVKREWSSPHCACPYGVENWIDWGDHGPTDKKSYIYITGYKTKHPKAAGKGEAGYYLGYAWSPLSGSGDLEVTWRSSSARGRAYYCVVRQHQGKMLMDVYQHNQRGDGGTYSVSLGNVDFAGTGQ